MKVAFISLSCLLGVAYSQKVYYNVDELSMPRFRFQFWNALSLGLRNDALSIGYNQGAWQTMATNQIEEYSYFIFQDTENLDDKDLEKVVKNLDVSVSNVTAVLAEMGFDEDTYDCWMNHYGWYDWDELEQFGLAAIYGVLGWDASNWESENEKDYPDSEEKDWTELTPSEKQAAANLCYLPEIWDEQSLASFLTTSLYIKSIEPWLITNPPTEPPTNPPTAAPTEAPTANPTTAPTKAPTLAPIVTLPPPTSAPVTISPAGAGVTNAPTEVVPVFCFSAYTTVEMEDGRSAQMKNLRLGDRVLAANGKYETIYSFGHFDTSVVKAEFLQIQTSTSSGLELTPNHLIFTEGNQAVPASSISVGDRVTMASGEAETVISITTVKRTGIFAPFTPSGTVVTNGIKSSSFATIQGSSPYVSLGGFEIPLTYHQLGVIFESPHRLFCLLSFEQCAHYESYNIEGMSQWVEKPMVGFRWLVEQNIIVSSMMFFLSFTFLCMLNLIEMSVVNPVFGFSLMMMAFIASRCHFAIKKV